MRRKTFFLIFILLELLQDSVLVSEGREKPVISPESPVVQIGEPVELTCISRCAGGKPEWRFMRDSAPGKVTSSGLKTVLRIDKVLDLYEGYYICTIICAEEYYFSKVLLAVYSFPHSPKVELQTPNPVAGQTVTLECSAQDLYPCYEIKVFWYHNLELLGDQEKTVIQNLESMCNVLSHLNYKTNTGNKDLTFTCKIELDLSTKKYIAKNASLEIHLNTGLHNIWIEPTRTVGRAGDPLSISCGADGSPVPTITWRKSGPGTGTLAHWNITRENGRSTLNINELRSQDGGFYICDISSGGNSTERQSSVEVWSELHNIWIEPTRTVGRAGDPLSISCGADGSPVPTITWRKSGPDTRTPAHWNITRENGRSTLNINELQSQDGGFYICDISSGGNSSGGNSTERQSSVEVWYGPQTPSITGSVKTGREGESLTITCSGDANPEPNISWGKTDPSEQRGWNISGSRGRSELRIDSLRPDDKGIYECVVGNKMGEVRLQTWVDVEYSPRNVTIDGAASARQSESLTITCSGDANPEPNITWGKMDPSEQRRWNVSGSRGRSELRIDSLRPDDQGIYECVVGNKIGEVRLQTRVDVSVTVKAEQQAVTLGLYVLLTSLVVFGTFFCLFRKRLFKALERETADCREQHHQNLAPPTQSSLQ
ncbi:vascular cell adhesion protein 1-like isoform X1 [Heptranchias perlo]|uniref:vascular cell adhesion protein 1-like isoform X1 n=1 Tax=Heptranchias perlo TaxID=212740 RepID=UPI00355A0F5E